MAPIQFYQNSFEKPVVGTKLHSNKPSKDRNEYVAEVISFEEYYRLGGDIIQHELPVSLRKKSSVERLVKTEALKYTEDNIGNKSFTYNYNINSKCSQPVCIAPKDRCCYPDFI